MGDVWWCTGPTLGRAQWVHTVMSSNGDDFKCVTTKIPVFTCRVVQHRLIPLLRSKHLQRKSGILLSFTAPHMVVLMAAPTYMPKYFPRQLDFQASLTPSLSLLRCLVSPPISVDLCLHFKWDLT